MSAEELEQTARSRLRRKAERGRYDRAVVETILDEALVCHVGVEADGSPLVLPSTAGPATCCTSMARLGTISCGASGAGRRHA
jgi:hypothetical protein